MLDPQPRWPGLFFSPRLGKLMLAQVCDEIVEVDYGILIAQAIETGGFHPFEVKPYLHNEVRFASTERAQRLVRISFFDAKPSHTLADMPAVLADLGLRPAEDLREAFAVGRFIGEERFGIFAPKLLPPHRPDLILKIERDRNDNRLGMRPSQWIPDEDLREPMLWIGFSDVS